MTLLGIITILLGAFTGYYGNVPLTLSIVTLGVLLVAIGLIRKQKPREKVQTKPRTLYLYTISRSGGVAEGKKISA
ncbi:MAG: hypothetical protein ACK5MN_03265 [Lachnospiraceae bacterium]